MNLLRIAKNRQYKNRRDIKYMMRTDTNNKQILNGLHKYYLKSLLNPSFNFIDIYKTQFGSIYQRSAPYSQLQDVTKLSQFYLVYVEYVFLHELMSAYDTDRQGKKIRVNDLIDNEFDRESNNALIKQTNKLFENLFEKHRQLVFKNREKKYKDYHGILRQTIRKVLQNFYQTLDKQYQWIKSTQFLPVFIESKQDLVSYIKNQFDKLQNIHIMTPRDKKEMVKQTAVTLSPFIYFKYQENKHKNGKDIVHSISIQRFSNQDQPVITSLLNYFNFRKKQRMSNVKQNLNNCSAHLVKQIFRQCALFYKFTNTFYPFIDINSISFDQKALRPVLNHIPLIYDSLGLRLKENGSLEVNLATNSTPEAIDFQKSVWEYDERDAWNLVKKYYGIKYNNKQKNQLSQQQQGQKQNEQLNERVHVWRLICIFYAIMNDGQHLTYNYYNTEMSKQLNVQNPPFYQETYIQILHDLQNKLRNQPQVIQTYLKWPQQDWSLYSSKPDIPKEKQKPTEFDFKIQQLQNLLSMSMEDDSLIQKKRFASIEQELWGYQILSKEIWQITHNDKFFRNLANSLKYTIGFFVTNMQIAYSVGTCLWHSEHSFQLRRQLHRQLRQYKGFAFSVDMDRKKSYLENSFSKINEYLGRRRTDKSKIFFDSNSIYEIKIRQVHALSSLMTKVQTSIEKEEKEIQIENDPAKKKEIKERLIKDRSELKRIVAKIYNEGAKMLEKIMGVFFNKDNLSKVQEYHRDYKPQQKTIMKYVTIKLYYLVKTYLTMAPENWIKYQSFIFPILFSQKTLGITNLTKIPIEERSPTQIDKHIKEELQYIDNMLSREIYELKQ